MPLIRSPQAGAAGINKDLSKHDLPFGVFTDGQDVRFLDGYAIQFLGHSSVYGDPEIVPYHILPVLVDNEPHWMYAGSEKIYIVSSAGGTITHTNLTRQTASVDVNYTALPNEWTSCILGGIPILNPGNETDPPQQWDLNLANRVTALDNWPADTYCKSLRNYKNILIALNVTKSGDNFPYLVKWSHPADPGGVPISWDETDPTIDAGEFDLAEGYDHIIDGMTLRDSFMIYKESSVWRLDYVGGAFIFRNQKVLGMSGAINRNCIVDVDGFHVVFTNNDIVVHDGVNATSILDKVTRRWLFENIHVDFSHLCFAFKNPFFNEVFLCFPASDSNEGLPNKAIVYNYVDKLVSIRSLPNVYSAAIGPVSASGLIGTWEQDPDPWGSDMTIWNGADFVPNRSRVIMGASTQELYLLDGSLTYDGDRPESFIERVGLSFGEPETIKTVRGIRPRILGQDGASVMIKVGYQNDPYETPTYTAEMMHTIGETVSNDCFVSGRYIAIRFEAGSAYTWRLDSFEVDVVSTGRW